MTQQERLKKLFEENAIVVNETDAGVEMISLNTFIRVASELLEERWIRVEDRLPEKSGEVLCISEAGDYLIGDVYENEHYFCCESESEHMKYVTHWKELQPPNN